MAKAKIAKISWLQIFVALWAVGMVVGLIATQAKIGNANLFDLRFNAYALLSLTCALVNLSFAAYVLRRRNEFKSDEITWYLLFVYSVVFFGFFEMFQRLSATPQAAIFWAALSGIAPGFLGVGLLLFAIQFTRPNVKLNHFIPILLLCGAILFFFFGNGNTLFINTVQATKLFPWGYNNDVGKAFVLDPSWALGTSLIAIIIMVRFRRRTRNTTLKKQARLFIIAFMIPLLVSVIFDSLIPIFGLKAPPLAGLSTVATAGLILYGLAHYRIFKITPASMSTDVLSTMTESVVVTDKNLQIHFMNEAANSLFRKYQLENSNISLIDFFTEDEAKHMLEEISKISGVGNKHVMGNYLYDHDTSLRMTAVKISEQHGVDGYIFAIADVTELQKSYQALEEAEKTGVEKKVEDRTRELRIAQQRLAETDKIKTEFVILTSHNLRTPLTKIRGNLEFFSDTKLSADQKKFIDELDSNTKRLTTLVEELLTINEIESGDKASLKTINLNEVTVALTNEAEELAKTSGNKYELIDSTKDIKIKASPVKLVTALHNVMENAFKFTKNGTISLEITKSDNKVLLTIRDTGIGISPEEQSKLFTKFHRGTDYMKYEYEGQGIGLYLTKLIINEHKGTINVVSQQGKGTAVTISLPVE